MKTNWKIWNAQYEDQSSHLSQRLKIVKGCIKNSFKDLNTLNIISICSGYGKDILESLVETKTQYSKVTLVDLDQKSIRAANAYASSMGLKDINCVIADAGLLSTYVDIKAELVVFVGALGHFSFKDIKNCLAELNKIVCKNGLVVWSANERVLETLLQSFTDNNYKSIDLIQKISEKGHVVGVHRYLGEEKENSGKGRLFTYDERLSF